MEVFKWLNDQLLRMDWLAQLVRMLLEDGFGIDTAGRLGGSLHFFIYDVIKIFILLGVLIYSISWVQSTDVNFRFFNLRKILSWHTKICRNPKD